MEGTELNFLPLYLGIGGWDDLDGIADLSRRRLIVVFVRPVPVDQSIVSEVERFAPSQGPAQSKE